MARESYEAAKVRWEQLKLLQEHYKDFNTLLIDVMENFMGFTCTRVQLDIGAFLSTGPTYAMVQAQRGQAKTTITAIYAVWRLIHDPSFRVLIISAGGSLATEIANWVIQIINGMDELECLRPDKSNGDRSSVLAFDVHYSLKGPEKSPSIACVGITSNLQGKRADLIIADDIESKKNSETELQRSKLRELTKDFTSICSKGKILYLGTPQSIDSIYNSLPSRGYEVRVWTGRYPTVDQIEHYGNSLAPMLVKDMQDNPDLCKGGGLDGTQGQPIDPVLLDEEALTKKELDQGPAYFQLQHMLNTKLMDADRYPLKLSSIMFMSVPSERVPLDLNHMQSPEYRMHTPIDYPIDEKLYEICGHNTEWANFTSTHMYLDPSGGGRNGDELAWAVTKFRSGYVYLVEVHGIAGGLHEANQQAIVQAVLKWKPDTLTIEDNMGAGTFRQVLTPLILEGYKSAGLNSACGIEGVWETGQKELRIINTMEPLISGGRFVVDKALVEKEWRACSRYGLEKRPLYSAFFQMARITRERGCLGHDDRLDAIAGSCRHWENLLAMDKKKDIAKMKNEAYRNMMRDPLGDGSNLGGKRFGKQNNIFERFFK